MIKLDPILPTYPDDIASTYTWGVLAEVLDDNGSGFYKHPNLSLGGQSEFPDFVILTKKYSPVVVLCNSVEFGSANVLESIRESVYRLEDMVEALSQRFNRDRALRGRLVPKSILSLPSITPAQAHKLNIGGQYPEVRLLLSDGHFQPEGITRDQEASDEDFARGLSILQTANAINRSSSSEVRVDTTSMSEAIKQLDRAITLLDTEQQKAALNIPPGPQCIRGLAGTGKTVLLAMKAASIHSHYPDRRILFTFNTQSLYNQVRSLVTRFYRQDHFADPDWDKLHVRHAWGGRYRNGVYWDYCQRHGHDALTFDEARRLDREEPFRACCLAVLSTTIEPYYDFILVDEAQDFPVEYFQFLWPLAVNPHRIYYAYDELQSLSTLEMPSPGELFGQDGNGIDRFDIEGEYPGPMEKILTLTKSYRCPLEVLMLAHGVGLGIHGPRGPVQMLESATSWRALGYDPGESILEAGQDVEIVRSPENSPNVIGQVYKGTKPLVTVDVFENREDELDAIAEWIRSDVNDEGIAPHQVIVISLNNYSVKRDMSALQRRLQAHGIASTIPGLVDDSSEFAEEGRVTLSTAFRSKGNEAPIVYIFGFERLFDYAEEISIRNRAFTCISRSKGWVSITGSGPLMKLVGEEIEHVRDDIPSFRFEFPDMETIQRRLDPSETTRRKQQVTQAKKTAKVLEELEVDAIASLGSDELRRLVEKLKAAQESRGEA